MGLDGTKVDINKALTDAPAGMDQALLKAVQANAIALEQLGLAEEDFATIFKVLARMAGVAE